MILQVLSPNAALHTSHDPSFETVRNDSGDDLPMPAWEAAQNDKSKPWSSEVAAAASQKAPGEVQHRPIEGCRNQNDDVIVREVQSAVKESVATETVRMVEEALDEVLG